MNAAQSCWKIDGTEALLCCGPLQAQVLLHAFPRLVPQRWGDKPFDDVAPLLFRGPDAADGRLTLREAYTRLDDLVLTYDLAAPLHMTAQLYWRASHVADGVTRVALI
ncbi:MAG: hypothetical protein SFU86_18825, partial [Pirellulaceae bacterium]|nr:hypothetical protein [Pirellulaceae bacterium]